MVFVCTIKYILFFLLIMFLFLLLRVEKSLMQTVTMSIFIKEINEPRVFFLS